MPFYVYILRSQATQRYYIGSTNDLVLRLKQHNAGKVRSTRNQGPYRLVYSEAYASRQLAYQREYQIKQYKSGQAFKKLVS